MDSWMGGGKEDLNALLPAGAGPDPVAADNSCRIPYNVCPTLLQRTLVRLHPYLQLSASALTSASCGDGEMEREEELDR